MILPDGTQGGVLTTNDALRLAEEAGLDLVEVAPNMNPPTARLMDWGKFRYEQSVKARAARKHQAKTIVHEMKFRPQIDEHDYETKRGHVVRFLSQGAKVKVTVMFRGRQQSRPEMGTRLLQRLAADVAEIGKVEQFPTQLGRDMTMLIAPTASGHEA